MTYCHISANSLSILGCLLEESYPTELAQLVGAKLYTIQKICESLESELPPDMRQRRNSMLFCGVWGPVVSTCKRRRLQSADLRVVRESQDCEEALSGLGYTRTNDYYKHPDSKFPLELPPRPLAIGDDEVKVIEQWCERENSTPNTSYS